MSLLTRILGQDPPPTGRTPREKRRRAKEIKAIDASASAWLRAGGRAAKTPKGWC